MFEDGNLINRSSHLENEIPRNGCPTKIRLPAGCPKAEFCMKKCSKWSQQLIQIRTDNWILWSLFHFSSSQQLTWFVLLPCFAPKWSSDWCRYDHNGIDAVSDESLIVRLSLGVFGRIDEESLLIGRLSFKINQLIVRRCEPLRFTTIPWLIVVIY